MQPINKEECSTILHYVWSLEDEAMCRVLLLTCHHSQGCTDRKLMTMQPINKEEFSTIFGPAAMHAVGHVAANLSFAAVAISLTHTVKTLEPAFNVLLSKLFLGVGTPLPVVATLVPIMVWPLQAPLFSIDPGILPAAQALHPPCIASRAWVLYQCM